MGRGPGGNPPKILSLVEFTEEHWEDIDADFLSHYHVDLSDVLGTRRMTWGRLGYLLSRLPRESCTARSLIPEDERDWDLDAHLMALIADRLAAQNYLTGQLIVSWSAKGVQNPVPKPEPIPRPGAKPKQSSERGMRAFIKRLGAQNRR